MEEPEIEVNDAGEPVSIGVTLRRKPGWVFRLRVHRDESGVLRESGDFSFSPPDGERIDAEMIRALPLGEALLLARKRLQGDLISGFLFTLGGAGDSRKLWRTDPATIAAMYRFALATDVPPADAIGAAFDRSPISARRWIGNARKAGFLGTPEEEKAAHGFPARGRKLLAAQQAKPRTPMTEEDWESWRALMGSPDYLRRTGRVHSRSDTPTGKSADTQTPETKANKK